MYFLIGRERQETAQQSIMAAVESNGEDVKSLPKASEKSGLAKTIARDSASHFSDSKGISLQHLPFATYSGTGLLDKIAGHEKIFPDDSSRAFGLPLPLDHGTLAPPRTYKVETRGQGRGSENASPAKRSRNEDERRNTRPRNSLQGWNTTYPVQTGYFYEINGTTTTLFEHPLPQPYVKAPFGQYVPHHQAHQIAFPPPFPYDPAHDTFPLNVWDRQQKHLLESLPYVDADVGLPGFRPVQAHEDDEIVFLGEKRSVASMEGVEMQKFIVIYPAPNPKREQEKPPISQRMDDVVGLFLEAAQVIEGNEIHMELRGSTDSSIDEDIHLRAQSPPIPTSLSPLHTLANLSAERLKTEVPRDRTRSRIAPSALNLQPASSVWIRGGYRANNKETLTAKLKKKPYDRPQRLPSPSNVSTSSEGTEESVDFAEFERQAATRKRSYPGRASILSGASLSEMPVVAVKKVTFKERVPTGKDPRKTKSASAESVSERVQKTERMEPVKGRPLSSSPVKRGRGRPRREEVQAKNAAEALQKQTKARPKAEPEIQVITRSGRVVKRVVKASYD